MTANHSEGLPSNDGIGPGDFHAFMAQCSFFQGSNLQSKPLNFFFRDVCSAPEPVHNRPRIQSLSAFV
jgi:hypothetical protein